MFYLIIIFFLINTEKIKYRYAHTGSGDSAKTRQVFDKANSDAQMCNSDTPSSLDTTYAQEYVLNKNTEDKVDFYKASA